jgi:hypothetical protein
MASTRPAGPRRFVATFASANFGELKSNAEEASFWM